MRIAVIVEDISVYEPHKAGIVYGKWNESYSQRDSSQIQFIISDRLMNLNLSVEFDQLEENECDQPVPQVVHLAVRSQNTGDRGQ